MKLIRFGEAGKEKPGIVLNEKHYDVSAHVQDYKRKKILFLKLLKASAWEAR